MNREEFRKYVMENDDNITNSLELSNGFKNFNAFCKKCGSGKTKILVNGFHYSEGSEYTGIYGENIDLLIKCLDCGNAEEINLGY